MSKSKKTAKAKLTRADVKHGAVAVVSNPPLLTASQIEKDCPVLVQDLGKRIAVHYEKLVQCEGKAEQHKITIGKLLVQAKEACDAGGFIAFRARFCPNLGRSRAHELLLIASGKKTIEETKTATRERVKKHRAAKKAASSKVSAPSVTVTDDPAASAEKRKAEYADPPKINGKLAATKHATIAKMSTKEIGKKSRPQATSLPEATQPRELLPLEPLGSREHTGSNDVMVQKVLSSPTPPAIDATSSPIDAARAIIKMFQDRPRDWKEEVARQMLFLIGEPEPPRTTSGPRAIQEPVPSPRLAPEASERPEDLGKATAEEVEEDEEEDEEEPRRKRRRRPEPRQVTIKHAIEEASGKIDELADEMQSWADSMPENLQDSSKHEQVTDAGDALTQIAGDVPNIDEPLAELTVEIEDPTPRKHGYSRPQRCRHAINIIERVIERLEDAGGEAGVPLLEELRIVVGAAEDVEFPSRMG
jgi:hypothetical protein